MAAETLRLVAEVKAAFFTFQGDQQLLARLKIIQETNAAALDLAQKQFEAGNITDFALLQSQSSYSKGRLDFAKAETDLRSQREKLNRLLGLWGEDTDWEIKGDIMPTADSDFTTKRLICSLSRNDSICAAHRDLTSVISALGLTKLTAGCPF